MSAPARPRETTRGAIAFAAGDEPSAADIVFVGAGASTSYTLLSLLSELQRTQPVRTVRILVAEKDADAFTGVPYGGRTARTSLLITSLRDFLPEVERSSFRTWLAANKDWAFDNFRSAGGPFAERWCERHADAIRRDDFDSLFLPRYTFGHFLRERVQSAISRAEASRTAIVRVVTDEVRTLAREDTGWTVGCRGSSLRGHRVVLAIGSPPTLSRLSAWNGATSAVLLDDPFSDMEAALGRIGDGLRRQPSGHRASVVLVGGNASMMDLLYLINNLAEPRVRDATFTVLSPRGLPARLPDADVVPEFMAESLAELMEGTVVEAESIYRAAIADIARGKRVGLSPAMTLHAISEHVARLLPRLSREEAAMFAGRWGAEIGRHQRRAGWEYFEVVDSLTAEGRLLQVSGRFVGLRTDETGAARVRSENSGVVTEWSVPADVVVNCAGPSGDLHRSAPPPLEQLVADGICTVTPYAAGLSVGPTLEAAPGLHVMGPLLAGNVLDGGPLWHMEHCGRISASGTRLGRDLARWVASRP